MSRRWSRSAASAWRIAEVRDLGRIEAERVDRDRLGQSAGVDREDRGRRIRDHHVRVLGPRRPEAALVQRVVEQRLDLLLVHLRGPERLERLDRADRRERFGLGPAGR